jgi:hypothetical protein
VTVKEAVTEKRRARDEKKEKKNFWGRGDPEYIGAGPLIFTCLHVLFFALFCTFLHSWHVWNVCLAWLVLNVCLASWLVLNVCLLVRTFRKLG